MITRQQALHYELRSSPLVFFLGFFRLPDWASAALGAYYAWKVNRKMDRCIRYMARTTPKP